MGLIIGLVLLLISVILALVWNNQRGRLGDIARTPLSTIRELRELAGAVGQELGDDGSAFEQTVSVEGTIECDSPLSSELNHQSCVYYEATVSREYEEVYYETDSQTGRRESRTRQSSQEMSKHSDRVPFWLNDGSYRILVEPRGADIDADKSQDRFESSNESVGQISFGSISLDLGSLGVGSGNRTLGYRLRERALSVGRRAFVLGRAHIRQGELVIEQNVGDDRFLVSAKSRVELMSSTKKTILWLQIAAISCGLLGAGLTIADLVGVI